LVIAEQVYDVNEKQNFSSVQLTAELWLLG